MCMKSDRCCIGLQLVNGLVVRVSLAFVAGVVAVAPGTT